MFGRRAEWTIVLFATPGLTAFVRNALIGIRRCGIDLGLVQLVYPAQADGELGRLAKTYGARPRLLEQMVEVKPADIPASYVEWGTREFNLLLRYRFPALRKILTETNHVVYADIDIGWLRNPLPYLSDVLQHYSWACQTEATANFPPSFCLGFFALARTRTTFKLIDRHIALSTDERVDQSDQALFRDILIERPKYLASIFPLPEALFPVGLLYPSVHTSEAAPVAMEAKLEPFIFHGNWCVGLENKRRLLAHAGAWFEPTNAADKPSDT